MKETLKENILADEKKLWEQAFFVFDSSALLNFYEYSEKTRQEIFAAVFKNLILKVTYFDEARTLYTNYVRFWGSEILNSEQ